MEEGIKPVAGEDEQGIVEDDSTSGTSLTRRKALGVGAVALGGAAIGGLAGAGRAEAATKTIPNTAVFKAALTKLATNSTYRTAATKNPSMVTHDYPSLSPLQLDALRDCAILSGANIAAINKVRAAAITSAASSNPGAVTISVSGGPGRGGWQISCSSCCCCCGETAVLLRP